MDIGSNLLWSSLAAYTYNQKVSEGEYSMKKNPLELQLQCC